MGFLVVLEQSLTGWWLTQQTWIVSPFWMLVQNQGVAALAAVRVTRKDLFPGLFPRLTDGFLRLFPWPSLSACPGPNFPFSRSY